MKAFSETVDDNNYLEIILTNQEIDRLDRGILVCGVVEIGKKVYNIGVRKHQFPFSNSSPFDKSAFD